MNLFELFVKIGVDNREATDGMDETGKKANKLGEMMKKGLSAASKVTMAAVAAGAGAVVALTKSAIQAYSEYEQLIGGVETLFKDSAGTVLEYANNAYKTAGLSANEYMSTVTSFSASLLQSLGGDTEAAAKYADMAVTDMSDNANKMGTSMEMIQNAYQGFAKQNYTMLDNLKLGYGGTKEEMQRLLDKANELNAQQGIITNYQIDSYADIVDAIHVVQTDLGITGTTALEASTTIQGSLASMKSAWQNLLTGVADDNANFEGLVNNFVDSLVVAGENIIPRINTVIKGLTQLITQASQTIIPLAVDTLLQNIPSIVAAGMDMVLAIVNGILDNIDLLIDCTLELVDVVVDKLIENLPKLIDGGIRLTLALASGIIEAIPQLLAKLPQLVVSVIRGLNDGFMRIGEIGKNIVIGIWNGIARMGDWLWDQVSSFFSGIVNGVKNLLGIASPSKVFAEIGGFMAEGLGGGFDDQFKSVKENIEKSMNVDGAYASINVSGNAQIKTANAASRAHNTQNNNDRSIHLTVVSPDGKELARFIAPYMGAQLQLVRG